MALKKILIFSLLLFFGVQLICQNNSIIFGNNSYVNIGNQAGNGLRTIEMWIQPNFTIDSTLSSFLIPIQRNTVGCGECDEFAFAFNQFNVFKPGHLRFKVHNSAGTKFEVYSDTNYFQIGVWYHIAASIHPANGISLYINGIKQRDTEPNYTATTTSSSRITAIAAKGDEFSNNFNGRIDEVRLSSLARYDSSFTPACSFVVDSNTIAYYKMDQITSTNITNDETNNHDGIVRNGSLSSLAGCSTVELNEIDDIYQLSLYPNPTKQHIYFSVIPNGLVRIYNLNGILVFQERVTSKRLDVSFLAKGIYFLEVQAKNQKPLKLIKT